MKKLLALVCFSVVLINAQPVSQMPGGVSYKAELVGLQNGHFVFNCYGSTQVNCQRLNETYDAELGFNVSDHVGMKYNYAYYLAGFQFRQPNSETWESLTTNSEGDNVEAVYRIYKQNLDTYIHDEYIYVRFKWNRIKVECANYQQTYNNYIYWMHNRTVIPDNALGGTSENLDPVYQVWKYDGSFKGDPELELSLTPSKETDLSGNYRGYVKEVTAKVRCKGLTASELNGLSGEQRVVFTLSYTNQNNLEKQFFFDLKDQWRDGGGEDNGYAIANVIFIMDGSEYDYVRYWYVFQVESYINYDAHQINSNSDSVVMGNTMNYDSLMTYRIFWSVTEEGTINAVVYSVYKVGNNEDSHLFGGVVSSSSTVWTCNQFNETQVGRKFVFNPYRSDNPRDVPRLVTITALLQDDIEGIRQQPVTATVIMPPLGESRESDERPEDMPNDEDRPKGQDSFQSDGTLDQTNEILNDLLTEFKNGRDEQLGYFEDLKNMLRITDNGTHNIIPADPNSPDAVSVMDELGSAAGEGLGAGLAYGDELPAEFGNGLGQNLEYLKNVTDHDMVLTLDFRGLGAILTSVDTSSWVTTVHLLPDTSTEYGQGVERITKQYVRPFILYALYIVLGIACVKDITRFFGNG